MDPSSSIRAMILKWWFDLQTPQMITDRHKIQMQMIDDYMNKFQAEIRATFAYPMLVPIFANGDDFTRNFFLHLDPWMRQWMAQKYYLGVDIKGDLIPTFPSVNAGQLNAHAAAKTK